MDIKSFADVTLKSGPEGSFTALIASFDKPDKAGDVLRRGAFSRTIAQWQASGSRIPVIFSHAWRDPQAHIGEVDPVDIRETAAGVEATGHLYLNEANGAKVFSQLQRKTLREWSYGFTIQRFKTLADGCRELLAVDLIELGPCVIGVGDTATLATKAEDVQAALAAHRRQLVAAQLEPYRARLDVVRRRIALQRSLQGA
jgi:HK97 family phage prohead protease